MSVDWGIYIPEEYENQKVTDMSIAMLNDGNEFACANMAVSRDLFASFVSSSPDGAGATGQIAVGGLERDELGYTHATFVAVNLSPNRQYSTYIGDGPCSELFPVPQPLAGLSTTFTTDGSGINRDVAFHAASVIGPAAESIVVRDAGTSTDIMCYDLEILVQEGKQGAVSPGTERNDVSACDAWAELYRGPSEPKTWTKYGKNGKGKKNGGKHGKYRSFAEFADTSIDGSTRCCLSDQYSVSRGAKGEKLAKMSALTWKFGAGQKSRPASSSFYVGIGSGLAGVVVLAAGVIMHVRRTRQPAYDIISDVDGATEATPLNKVTAATGSPVRSAAIVEDEGFDDDVVVS
jgi:hypothetical protein